MSHLLVSFSEPVVASSRLFKGFGLIEYLKLTFLRPCLLDQPCPLVPGAPWEGWVIFCSWGCDYRVLLGRSPSLHYGVSRERAWVMVSSQKAVRHGSWGTGSHASPPCRSSDPPHLVSGLFLSACCASVPRHPLCFGILAGPELPPENGPSSFILFCGGCSSRICQGNKAHLNDLALHI